MFVEADSFGEDAGRVAVQQDGAVFLVVLRATGVVVSQQPVALVAAHPPIL